MTSQRHHRNAGHSNRSTYHRRQRRSNRSKWQPKKRNCKDDYLEDSHGSTSSFEGDLSTDFDRQNRDRYGVDDDDDSYGESASYRSTSSSTRGNSSMSISSSPLHCPHIQVEDSFESADSMMTNIRRRDLEKELTDIRHSMHMIQKAMKKQDGKTQRRQRYYHSEARHHIDSKKSRQFKIRGPSSSVSPKRTEKSLAPISNSFAQSSGSLRVEIPFPSVIENVRSSNWSPICNSEDATIQDDFVNSLPVAIATDISPKGATESISQRFRRHLQRKHKLLKNMNAIIKDLSTANELDSFQNLSRKILEVDELRELNDGISHQLILAKEMAQTKRAHHRNEIKQAQLEIKQLQIQLKQVTRQRDDLAEKLYQA